ncbi:MAG: hypothetical protein ABI895_38040 [Deltaproteobacteria bacterium]
MKTAVRSFSGLLLLVLASGVACNDDCDERCQSDYDDCVSNARGDDAKADRCDPDRDQCMGICASQPVDFNTDR